MRCDEYLVNIKDGLILFSFSEVISRQPMMGRGPYQTPLCA